MNRSSKKISTEDKIWKIIEETQKSIKETQKNIRELSAQQKRMEQKREEAEKKRAQERKKEEKISKESTRKMEASIEALSKVVNTHMGNDGNRWGRLGENLVKGNLARRLKERGFLVERVMTRIKRGDTEFDIVAINGREVVVVEVRATLDPSDVRDFEENITKFKTYWPEFKKKPVYGAVAFLMKCNRQADILARKRGFLVIEAVGDVIIQNHKKFKPKVFS